MWVLFFFDLHFHLDCSEQLEVDNGKQGEWDEGHPQEVGDEDVVPRVRQVCSEGRRAEPAKHLMSNCTLLLLPVAPGYGDQCGVHAAVDAHHGHVHHLQESGLGRVQKKKRKKSQQMLVCVCVYAENDEM